MSRNLLITMIAACAPAGGPDPGGESPVVAEVDGRPIRADTLMRALKGRSPYAAKPVAAREVLDALIETEILNAEAERRMIHLDPEVSMDRKRALVARLRAEIARREDERPISEADLRQRYASRSAEFNHPEEIHVLRTFLPDEPAARSWAQAARSRIADATAHRAAAQRTFKALAKGRAEDLGWIARADDQAAPPLSTDHARALSTLEVGAVTPPLKAQDGWAIYLLAGRRPQRTTSFASARMRLRSDVQRERRREGEAGALATAKERMDVATWPELLTLIPSKTPRAAPRDRTRPTRENQPP